MEKPQQNPECAEFAKIIMNVAEEKNIDPAIVAIASASVLAFAAAAILNKDQFEELMKALERDFENAKKFLRKEAKKGKIKIP